MTEVLKSFLFSKTSKDSSVLFAGTVISTLLNLVLVALLTRNLSPDAFGFIITALVFTQLIIDMFELGINPATLNFLSSAEGQAKSQIISSSVFLKGGIALVISLLVFVLAEILSVTLLKNRAITPLIQISGIGVFLGMMITWSQNIFQAQRRFAVASIINTSPNLLRFLVISLLIFLRIKNYQIFYLSFQMVLTITLFLSLPLFRGLKLKFEKEQLAKIFKFGLPLGLAFMLAAVYTRLDQLMIFNISGAKEAGIYGLAARLTTVFIFAAASFNTALLPRLASISREAFSTYFKKAFLATLGLALGGIVAILLAPLIPLIFGEKYSTSILPFQLLMIGVICFIISSPFNSALIYFFKKTKFSLFLSLGSLIIIYPLLNYLIPTLGSIGAAVSVSSVYLLQLLFTIVYFQIVHAKA